MMFETKPDVKYVYANAARNVFIEEPAGLPLEPSVMLNFYMGRNSYYQGGAGQISPNVFIGRYCSIARNVCLGASQHPMDHLTTGILNIAQNDDVEISPQEKDTVIGSDVWIGLNAIIMNGVNIGHGAVIGAGAVVTKDVPPYAIVGGVPAKLIRYRFDLETRLELLESEWWEYDNDELITLPKDDVKACIEYFKRKRNSIT